MVQKPQWDFCAIDFYADMIDKYRVQAYCCEDISKIENYDTAINDKTQVWHCHHRLEIQGQFRNLAESLDKCGLYYGVPAWQLIFMTEHDHHSLHSTGKECREYTRKKISESKKGKYLDTSHKIAISNSRKGKGTKKICQFTMSGQLVAEYESLTEASKITGVNCGNISSCCKGKLKHTGNFVWKYKQM